MANGEATTVPVPARRLLRRGGMNILRLLRRCEAIELAAASLYQLLGRRFAKDGELGRFFSGMATDERGHAKNLGTWRRFLEHRDPSRHPFATGFDESVTELEGLVGRLRKRARAASSAEEALRIALELESSELDTIYSMVLQSSPLARFPDLEETRKVEIGSHHQKLLQIVRARCRSEDNLLAAAILGARE
jgi:rubrerythrin